MSRRKPAEPPVKLRTSSSVSCEGIRTNQASLESLDAPFRVATWYRGRRTVRNIRTVHGARSDSIGGWAVVMQIESRIERSWNTSYDDREHNGERAILVDGTDPAVVRFLEAWAPEALR